ncbi:MAG: hypothetical protein C5B48_13050 [Candidatus Rokuibacteriota bacterium]|nr:MAG: hypothetical protein C5B48_13050 [Candidatus Rokubacteria bacterium]
MKDKQTDMSRRRFLATAGAVGATGVTLASAPARAQGAEAPTKETLRPVVDAADLAITDEQLAKLAGAVGWSRGELAKLREIETGIGGPANGYLPPPASGGDHE